MQPLGLLFGGWGNAAILPGRPEARGGVMQPLGFLFGGWGNAAILPGRPEARGGVMQPPAFSFGDGVAQPSSLGAQKLGVG